MDGPDGYAYYWHDLRKQPIQFSKRNFGGGSVMLWGAFCGTKLLDLEFTTTRINSEEYQRILGKRLVPFMTASRRQTHNFQQDNASVHNSRSTKDWLNRKGISVLKWPACSPDLNPIENLWGILARDVYRGGKQFNKVNELKQAIERSWSRIKSKDLKNLVNSMPNRVFNCIQRNGAKVDY